MTHNRPLISVIVPVFNVEPYLLDCISSIQRQSFTNFEALLIDDGSTDGSGEICTQVSNVDSRFKAFQKPNEGLASARNLGISNSQGSYLFFLDSDDWVSPDILEIAANAVQNHNLDVLLTPILEKWPTYDKLIPFAPIRPYIRLNGIQVVESYYSGASTLVVTSVGKLFKRNLFESLRFPFGRLHEDEFIFHHLFSKVHNVALAGDKPLYFYRRRESSIMGSYSPRSAFDTITAYLERARFIYSHPSFRHLVFNSSMQAIRAIPSHTFELGNHGFLAEKPVASKIRTLAGEAIRHFALTRMVPSRDLLRLFICYVAPYAFFRARARNHNSVTR